MELTKNLEANGLVVLEQRKESLITLASKYKGLKIEGVHDREGLKRVTEARKILKGERVQIQKDAEELREGAVKFQKAVIAKEKELIGLISPTEKELLQEEERIENLKEQLRIEEERRENERIQNRISRLAKFNYAIDLYDVTVMPEDQFNELLTNVEIQFKEELARQAAEREREEAAKREEEERLKREREELAKQRAEQEAREHELQRQEQERQAKIKAEQERFRKEEEERQAKIRAEREAFEAEKREFEAKVRKEREAKEAEERAAAEKKRLEDEAKEREHRAKIEAERQAALKPDKDKIQAYAFALNGVSHPIVSAKEAKQLAKEIDVRVGELCKWIIEQSEKL